MSTCFCWTGPPDWNEITSLATVVLALGVGIALLQLFIERRANRVLETGRLLDEWNDLTLTDIGEKLDQDPDDYGRDRARVLRLYRHVQGLKRFRQFRRLHKVTNDLIEQAAQLAERIEIYIRKGAADEGIIAEHLGYDVVSDYDILRDVFQVRATDEDYSYEGFRDLAVRVQDYAIIHPLDADLRGVLVWDSLPPLKYFGGDISLGYKKSLWRKIQLELALLRDLLFRSTKWAKDRAEGSRRYYAG